MRRVPRLGRVTLVGAAAAALLLGGVSPAFAEQDDAGVSEVEVEIVAPAEELPGSPAETGQEDATQGELPADEDEAVVHIPFAGGTPAETEVGDALANVWGPLRKVSGKITLPKDAPAAWMHQIIVGASCVSHLTGNGCGSDITINRKSGDFSMMVPAAPPKGATVTISAYAYNRNGVTANLVHQSWGTTCGVGEAKPVPAGTRELKNVNLQMCHGATIKGTVADPLGVFNSERDMGPVYAYVGGGLAQIISSAYPNPATGAYEITRVPRVNNVIVVFKGNWTAADQAWKNTYDVSTATPVDTTKGAASGINFKATPGFTDMCIDWAQCNKFYKEVMWMHDEGISTGFKNWNGTGSSFKPKDKVTREAMSAFLYRTADLKTYKPSKTPRFADVKPGHKFYKQIQWMGDTGVSTGTKRGGKLYFEPGKTVTREAMSAFLYRTADLKGYKPTKSPRFADVKSSHKFYKQIQWMGDTGVSTGTKKGGKSYYDPRQGVTREAMSAFLYRVEH